MTMRERRRHHRERASGGRIPVRHRASGAAWQDGEAFDIGAGGTFLVGAAWPVGTSVELAIDVAASDGALVLPGVVRWVSGDGSVDDEAAGVIVAGLAGVGVQFVGLDLDAVAALHAQLATLAPADQEPAQTAVGTGELAPPDASDDGDADDDDDADIPATD